MDEEFLWQVLQNVVSNAINYSASESVVSVNITVKKLNVEFEIQDTGIGIPAKEQHKIFNKFYRAKNAIKFLPQGSGLGLSLAKSLLEVWGGKIWFESKEGRGSSFFFTVPLKGVKPRKGEVTLAV